MEVQTTDTSRNISYMELEFIYGSFTYRGRIVWVELILSVCPECDGLRSLLPLNPPTTLRQQLYPPDQGSYSPVEMKHWKNDLQRCHRRFAVGEKILLPGPAPLAAAQLLQQLVCAWRDLQLNAKFIYFSDWALHIYLPSMTVCLSSLTWVLPCFLFPLPRNSKMFCNSWLGTPMSQGSWKPEDIETLLVKGKSNRSHSPWAEWKFNPNLRHPVWMSNPPPALLVDM